MSLMILVRGLPGSGKSTYVSRHHSNILNLEADKYFVRDGIYHFDRMMLGEAHEICLSMAKLAAESGMDFTVSNTLTTLNELYPYILLASKYGYSLTIVDCICIGNEDLSNNIHITDEETRKKVASYMSSRFISWSKEEWIEYLKSHKFRYTIPRFEFKVHKFTKGSNQ